VKSNKRGVDSNYRKNSDRINRIVRIFKHTQACLAAGEKDPINPVNPV
jgi:hypothetical protein